MTNTHIKLNDDRTLGYNNYGQPDGETVFLLHGTPGSRIFGLDDDPLVTEHNLRVITPERPGYGLSDPCENRTIRGFSTDIKELADYLDIRRFHIAGVSGGAPYALACAQGLAERVKSVTLIAGAAPADSADFFEGMSFGNKLVFQLSRNLPFLLKPLYMFASRSLIKKPEKLIEGLEPQLCAWDRDVIANMKQSGKLDAFVSHIREAYRQGYKGAYEDALLLTKSWDVDFKSIACPVYLWHGEQDTLMPIAPVRHFSQRLPNCECHFIPDAGHLLLEDEKTAALIIERMLNSSAL